MITPVAKFRNSDTRVFGVPLPANTDHEFGLNPTIVPVNAKGVFMTVAVVPQGQGGWCDIRPKGSPFQNTSTINYEPRGAHNGATFVGVEDLKVIVRASAPVHVILDVTGYVT